MTEPENTRSIIDRNAAAQLPPHDPNVACSQGDHDHENHIGDPVDDDPEVAAAMAQLAAGGAD